MTEIQETAAGGIRITAQTRPGPTEVAGPCLSVRVWMAGMKFRRVPLFALVIWYLMRPPVPRVNADSVHTNAAGPLANWAIVERFSTRHECEVRLRDSRWDVCVPSNDPRLNDRSINRGSRGSFRN